MANGMYFKQEPDTLDEAQARVDALSLEEFQNTAASIMMYLVQRDNRAFHPGGQQTANGKHIYAIARRLARELKVDLSELIQETDKIIYRQANPGCNVVELKR